MKKSKRIIKIEFTILAIFIMNVLGFINSVYASMPNSANIYCVGDCGQLLKYKGAVIKVSYVQYTANGADYPAYCMNPNKPRSRICTL